MDSLLEKWEDGDQPVAERPTANGQQRKANSQQPTANSQNQLNAILHHHFGHNFMLIAVCDVPEETDTCRMKALSSFNDPDLVDNMVESFTHRWPQFSKSIKPGLMAIIDKQS